MSNLLLAAFFAWPILLLIVKIRRPDIPQGLLWLSVPFVSWITINGAIFCSYRADGAGGGFGAGFNLLVAWIYMIPVFGFLTGGHAFWNFINRKYRNEKSA